MPSLGLKKKSCFKKLCHALICWILFWKQAAAAAAVSGGGAEAQASVDRAKTQPKPSKNPDMDGRTREQ